MAADDAGRTADFNKAKTVLAPMVGLPGVVAYLQNDIQVAEAPPVTKPEPADAAGTSKLKAAKPVDDKHGQTKAQRKAEEAASAKAKAAEKDRAAAEVKQRRTKLLLRRQGPLRKNGQSLRPSAGWNRNWLLKRKMPRKPSARPKPSSAPKTKSGSRMTLQSNARPTKKSAEPLKRKLSATRSRRHARPLVKRRPPLKRLLRRKLRKPQPKPVRRRHPSQLPPQCRHQP